MDMPPLPNPELQLATWRRVSDIALVITKSALPSCACCIHIALLQLDAVTHGQGTRPCAFPGGHDLHEHVSPRRLLLLDISRTTACPCQLFLLRPWNATILRILSSMSAFVTHQMNAGETAYRNRMHRQYSRS